MGHFAFCPAHWERLKNRIEELGLKPFQASSGPEVGERMQKDGTLMATKETFEPLMAAHT
jgi:hypothetical protein